MAVSTKPVTFCFSEKEGGGGGERRTENLKVNTMKDGRSLELAASPGPPHTSPCPANLPRSYNKGT